MLYCTNISRIQRALRPASVCWMQCDDDDDDVFFFLRITVQLRARSCRNSSVILPLRVGKLHSELWQLLSRERKKNWKKRAVVSTCRPIYPKADLLGICEITAQCDVTHDLLRYINTLIYFTYLPAAHMMWL